MAWCILEIRIELDENTTNKQTMRIFPSANNILSKELLQRIMKFLQSSMKLTFKAKNGTNKKDYKSLRTNRVLHEYYSKHLSDLWRHNIEDRILLRKDCSY